MLGLLPVSSRIKFYRPFRKDIKANRRPSATFWIWLWINFHCSNRVFLNESLTMTKMSMIAFMMRHMLCLHVRGLPKQFQIFISIFDCALHIFVIDWIHKTKTTKKHLMQIVSGRFIVALHLSPLPSYLLRLAHWQPSEDKNTLLLPECHWGVTKHFFKRSWSWPRQILLAILAIHGFKNAIHSDAKKVQSQSKIIIWVR